MWPIPIVVVLPLLQLIRKIGRTNINGSIKFFQVCFLRTFYLAVEMGGAGFYRSKLYTVLHEFFLYFRSKKFKSSISLYTLYRKRRFFNNLIYKKQRVSCGTTVIKP